MDKGAVMYQGDNQIAVASQFHIAKIFLALLEEKKFVDISVRDLCKSANVSRQTFYSLFETKENIILFELQNHHQFSLDDMFVDNERITVYDICQGFGYYLINHIDFLEKTIICGLTDMITDAFYQSIYDCKRFQYYEKEEKNLRKYYAAFIAGGLSNIMKVYIDSERDQSDREITKLCYSLLSGREIHR